MSGSSMQTRAASVIEIGLDKTSAENALSLTSDMFKPNRFAMPASRFNAPSGSDFRAYLRT